MGSGEHLLGGKGFYAMKDKPTITVTRNGVRQTTPTEILRSAIGRQVIKRTAELRITWCFEVTG